ncbi:MAG: glycosyltransferase [Sphingomonadaceae bacterium]|nr:glycosyltransferase [Sphingomonadaceae bacterium]
MLLLWGLKTAGARELTLSAAAGFLICGIDDLAVDLIWIVRSLWRRATVYRRHARSDAATLRPASAPGRIAVFIPAWDEARVIAAMLRNTIARFGAADCRIYVGAYPNDPATIAALRGVASPQVRLVVGETGNMSHLPDDVNPSFPMTRLWRHNASRLHPHPVRIAA